MTLKKHIISLFITKNKPRSKVKEQAKEQEEKEHKEEPDPEEEEEEESGIGIREQELEFEESRNMLHTDLFHTSLDDTTYFPQFEHLLMPRAASPKRPKSVTQSIRRRLSVSSNRFRPKSLKRAISSPNLSLKKDHAPFVL
ncbi:hypothetical protein G6F57_002915 [Rhizopus arrhizus]|uniref:Uncharacterized protein n=1 Tax=Rhizopus oryzae TaxID=64495 RepID=A0A9P6XJR7_RHIOR|nr:hypothetical protein G6F24_001908 [Rhizopus arrhizus]KAG1429487.1 hypothetical protein G6F58_000006 [Rhizopus delemar]KAG0789996.1 hypothetical protein G6F21_006117 [Rhizopus arrhizus]KAG0818894.1 hypothetical protein G6F20_001193 [Rhizopus arrhizus]KAG0843404.1 hypothetical protein G6F19_000504 [Rhizopus arrhizus]